MEFMEALTELLRDTQFGHALAFVIQFLGGSGGLLVLSRVALVAVRTYTEYINRRAKIDEMAARNTILETEIQQSSLKADDDHQQAMLKLISQMAGSQDKFATGYSEQVAVMRDIANLQQQTIVVHQNNSAKIDTVVNNVTALDKKYGDWSHLITEGMSAINDSLTELTETVKRIEAAKPRDIQAMIDAAVGPVMAGVNEMLALMKNPPTEAEKGGAT